MTMHPSAPATPQIGWPTPPGDYALSGSEVHAWALSLDVAAETLKLPTSRYRFASTLEEFKAAVKEIGLPCVVKPTMSSSGKGQSVVRTEADVPTAWEHAMKGRVKTGRVIVESFIRFDYEITLLTVRHAGGTSFCEPIGHVQVEGDYVESWQPQQMAPACGLAFEKIISGQVVHDGDPDVGRQVKAAVKRQQENGGFTLSKPRSRIHIDAAITLCMGVDALARLAPAVDWENTVW